MYDEVWESPLAILYYRRAARVFVTYDVSMHGQTYVR